MAALAAPAPTFAQETAEVTEAASEPVGDAVLGTIYVTTRKREKSLQDISVAVTALTDEWLRDANVFSLEDLAAVTPGLAFTNVGTFGTPVVR